MTIGICDDATGHAAMGRFQAIDPPCRRVHAHVVTEAEAVEAIQEWWESGWESLHPSDPNDPQHIPYAYEAEDFGAVAAFATVTIVNTVRQQTTSGPVGSRRFEQRGYIAVQLFTGKGEGVFDIVSLADDVRAVFEGKALVVGDQEIALFEGASGGTTTDARWSMKLVTIPFWYQAIA